MPNLSLTHSGNMNITSAEITSAGTLNVSYGPNNTGIVTGWSLVGQTSGLVCGDTYSYELIPQFSGTMLTETFEVSGIDLAGVRRSDTGVINQGYVPIHFYDLLLNYGLYTSAQILENVEYLGDTKITFDVTIDSAVSFDICARWLNYNVDEDWEAQDYHTQCFHIEVNEEEEPVFATSLTINVAEEIIASGQATATYTPTAATVDLVYSSSDTTKATIDPSTGAITVLADGTVNFCVTDQLSGLQDCKTVDVYLTHPGPDTGVTINSLTLIAPDTVEGTGYASAVYEPAYAAVDLHYSSMASGIASINETTGQIFVYQNGVVTICVTDTISGLSDCKTINTVIDPNNLYFTIFVTSGGTIQWHNSPSLVENCQYRKNYGEWVGDESEFIFSSGFTAESGDLFEFKCNCKTYTGSYDLGSTYFSGTTCEFITYGNIMSLAYGDDFLNKNTLINNGQFARVFAGCTGLTEADGLILPATELKEGSYKTMFQGCNNLRTAPKLLPAMNLSNCIYCYAYMFDGCTSLETTPEMPATALSQSCYMNMFSDCTSLVTPPVLSATTLSEGCYAYMFSGCTSLTTAPELPATRPGQGLWSSCYEYMFAGCTSLTAAPELPANGVGPYSYIYMFSGCTSLNYVKCMATYNMRFLDGWLEGVSPTGLFIKNPNASVGAESANRVYERGPSGIPVGWTIQDAS